LFDSKLTRESFDFQRTVKYEENLIEDVAVKRCALRAILR